MLRTRNERYRSPGKKGRSGICGRWTYDDAESSALVVGRDQDDRHAVERRPRDALGPVVFRTVFGPLEQDQVPASDDKAAGQRRFQLQRPFVVIFEALIDVERVAAHQVALGEDAQPLDALLFGGSGQVEALELIELDFDRVRSRTVEIAAVAPTLVAAQRKQVRRHLVALLLEHIQHAGPVPEEHR